MAYITKSTLKKRYWTDSAIHKFLGEPDKLVYNPHYKCAGQMQLFELERVENAEGKIEFHK